MNLTKRKYLDHQSPLWVKPESIYFITLCTEPRGLNCFCNSTLGPVLLDSIGYRHKTGIWFCHLAVLMPDHIHLLLNFPDIPSFTKVISDWKHYLARHQAIPWQKNFFDHRLRKDENLEQKAEYILLNPVRAGLVQEIKDWPYIWMPKG